MQQPVAGKYYLEKEIGRGGMGVVYRARTTDGRIVAFKTIIEKYYNHPQAIERFRREIGIMRRLNEHKHIVRVIDDGQINMFDNTHHRSFSLPFLVMLFIDGENLFTRVMSDIAQNKRGNPLRPREAYRMLNEIGSALEFAHASGVTHRDIKPNNIMMDKSGNFYLLDFGIAMNLNAEMMTQLGLFVGTPDYTAPEIIAGERKSDACSDVYSLGVTLFEVLVGITYKSARQQTNEQPWIFLEKQYPLLAPVINKAVQEDRMLRYPNVSELARDFQLKWRFDETWQVPRRKSQEAEAARPGSPTPFSEPGQPRIRDTKTGQILLPVIFILIILAVFIFSVIVFTVTGNQPFP